MDVRCERCKTEYEFDDARVTEAGVTVKCTSCGHVFRVKKKALAPHEAHSNGASGPHSAPGPGDKREWKVRQVDGNVFTFRQLTNLQRWIVEGKVTREDEISLTGETWRRLGDIAELGVFFRVVDEAQRAKQLEASWSASPNPAAFAPVPPTQAQIALSPASASSGRASPIAASPLQPAPTAGPSVSDASPLAATPSDSSTTPWQLTAAVASPAEDPVAPPEVASDPLPASDDETSSPEAPAPEWEAALRGKTGKLFSGAKGFSHWRKSTRRGMALLGAAMLAGAGWAGYTAYSRATLPVPDEPQAPAMRHPVASPSSFGSEDDPSSSTTPPNRVAPPSDAVAAVPAGANAAAVDPSLPSAPSAAPSSPPAPAAPSAKPERQPAGGPKKDFEWYMAQGDRLRDRERIKAALEAYRAAAEIAPHRAEPIAGKGFALLDLGQKSQAEAAFREALRLNPRYAVAVIGLAETYRQMGKTAQAIEQYELYLQILPEGSEATVAKAAIERLKE